MRKRFTGHLKTLWWGIAQANLTSPSFRVLPLYKQKTKATACCVPRCCVLGIIVQKQSAKLRYRRSWSRRSIWWRVEIETISRKSALLFDVQTDFKILIS